MSDGYKEYDPNEYLGGVQEPIETPSSYKEYDPNAYLNQVTQGEKPPSFLKSLKSKAHNVLKGAEYFAKGGAFAPKRTKEAVEGMASLADTTIGSIIPSAGSYIVQGVTRPFTTAEKSAEYGQKFAEATDKPFGKALGVTESPTYKNEASNRLMQYVSENMDKGADYVAEQTGLPKADVAHMMNSVAMAGGHAIGTTVLPKVKSAVNQVGEQFAAKKAALMEGRPLEEPVTQPKGFADAGFKQPEPPTVATEPQVAPKASVEVSQPTNTTLEPPQLLNVDGTPIKIAQVEAPVQPKPVEIKPLAENPEMPSERLNPEEISRKEQLLKDVGIESQRKSALEGDYQGASSQYITSKADNGEYAQGMTNQIRHEKEALTSHLEKIENELGGTIPREGMFYKTDEIKRGKAVKNALEEAQEAHKTETTRLYNKASEEIGAVPVELNTLKEYLDKDSNFVHSAEKSVKTGVRDYLKEQGLLDDAGAIKPMTVGQSEELRKFINKQYNHETKGKVGDLVNRIDEDVFKNVEGKTYEEARAHFKAGKEIYDNPKAIKDLMNDEGTNQKIKDEQVMTKISSLDESQFSNLIDTLTKTGKTDALKEIQTNLVNRVKQAGKSEINEPWNGRAAAKEFQNLGEKLQVAFKDNPEVLAELAKNIEAGHILHIPTRYPGAAVQTNLLKNKFSEIALQRAGAMIGGAGGSIAGPMGAAGGAVAGEYLATKGANELKSARQLKQLQKEIKSGPLGETGDKFKIKD